MQSTLYFHGGAGMVTGSNFLLETFNPDGTVGARFLVDCGLVQGVGGGKNWEPFAYNPADISHLIVTHAHLDHIGRIPRLVRMGFKGKIISTSATMALAEPLLLDAMEILGNFAERRGREELFNEHDISAAMALWTGIGYGEKTDLPDGIQLELLDAGHILGSAMALLRRGSEGQARSILFTGDLGGGNSPLLPPTQEVAGATYVVMEIGRASW